MYSEMFGKKLKKARVDAGYTQQQIEDLLGVNRATLSRYESGERQPDFETLGKLADFYEISVDWLLGTKGGNKTMKIESSLIQPKIIEAAHTIPVGVIKLPAEEPQKLPRRVWRTKKYKI